MPVIPARFRPLPGLVLATAGALALLASPLQAQVRTPTPTPPPTPTLKPVAAAPALPARPPGMSANIHVHGHWTIVVRNKDGSVAARREFENSLQFAGSALLPIVLGGYGTPGTWVIMLSGASNTDSGPCTISSMAIVGPNGGTPEFNSCWISSASLCSLPDFASNNNCSPGLAVSLINSGSVGFNSSIYDYVNLQLTGLAKMTEATQGTIDNVATALVLCNSPTGSLSTDTQPLSNLASLSTATPGACTIEGAPSILRPGPGGAGDFWTFTSTAVPGGPISVLPQQTVQVTVVISFS